MIAPVAEKSTAGAELSVVVPSVNGPADLVGCLEALEAQTEARLEILVIDRIGEAIRQIVRSRFPRVRLIGVPQGTTIPHMRAIAFAEARAESVAVIEDHVIVPRDWARRLLDAQMRTRAVVGGSVENAATERLVDWAAFLCEYSHCIPPLPAGPAEWLTGNNVVYPRAVLQRHRAVIEEGKWENHLHEALKRDGVSLVCVPEIAVGHKKHYTIREYLSQRYLYARSYAGARVVGQPVAKRVAYGIAAFALPPLLFYRTLTRVVSKGRHRAELVRSLPLLALFVTSWALGEVVGYWAGPGDSLGKVR
ncbi:MAG TPA: glycosyltransferase [Gemmatimonadaceae bacterium]|nr:glycosyltransferase [Gemmatimonadaceae bacterium]